MLYIISMPLSIGGLLCFSVCLSFSKDLYIPKCHPDGDIVVCSGHFQKPEINGSNSSGFSV